MSTFPLDGVRVVSLEQAVAAPLCARRLVLAGAEVFKIERPEGDFARYYDTAVAGQSAYFVWLNAGKKSVVLDLADEDDKILLLRLISRADVFIQNLKPGALAKLGIDLERPIVTTCSLGVGASGIALALHAAGAREVAVYDGSWEAWASR